MVVEYGEDDPGCLGIAAGGLAVLAALTILWRRLRREPRFG